MIIHNGNALPASKYCCRIWSKILISIVSDNWVFTETLLFSVSGAPSGRRLPKIMRPKLRKQSALKLAGRINETPIPKAKCIGIG